MPKVNSQYLLLDTHVWVWLINADDRLNRKQYMKMIDQYSAQGAVRVSAISVWELGMLVAKGRLVLSKNIHQWVQESLNSKGISLEPLSIGILLESASMEGAHGDPADRMILASAININAMIMTADKEIITYCRRHNLNVLPIR